MPPPGAAVYHRPTGRHYIVTAVHRAVQPPTFTVCDRDRTIGVRLEGDVGPRVGPSEVEVQLGSTGT